MEDHRSARISTLVESLLPWIRLPHGAARHVLTNSTITRHSTLCGLEVPAEPTPFIWRGRTVKPAGSLPVCGNCANVARAIVAEAE
jgi:hypothetical protein